MCGIVACVGSRQAQPILLEGLHRLEYRGYDSAGIAVLESGKLKSVRSVGRVASLEQKLDMMGGLTGTLGMAHTRWATHGAVTEHNAHPQTDDKIGVAVVHNGIIENYAALKTYLQEKGHRFTSDTDTEVLAMLIGELYSPADGVDLEAAVQAALREVRGAFAIAVICQKEPGTLVVARRGSPMIVGVGEHNGAPQYVAASDAAAIIAHTSRAMHLDDDHVVKITAQGLRTSDIHNTSVTPKVLELELELEEIELGGFTHYMRKEIAEQPAALATTMRGRFSAREGKVVLGGVGAYAKELTTCRRVILGAQGTALHAAMVGARLIEELSRVPASAEYASELKHRNPVIEPGTVFIAVSQSGETADTLSALREVKDRGALCLGVVNAVGSSISRATDAGVYVRVGPEIGVASTKAYTGQLTVLTMLALFLARRRLMGAEQVGEILSELEKIPGKIAQVLSLDEQVRAVTTKYVNRDNWLFLGRGYNYPTALEGALKLKELSYIHAEGMPAAEMKHGPIALIDDKMPVVFIAASGRQHEKVLGNIQEVKARGGQVIAICTEGDEQVRALADDLIEIPPCPEALSPMLAVIPLQLMAYHAAVLRGHDVDKPRNLAKSVTVE